MTKYCTPEDIATLYKIGVKTLYNWVYLTKQGEMDMPFLKVGKFIRFDLSKFQKWLEKRTKESMYA